MLILEIIVCAIMSVMSVIMFVASGDGEQFNAAYFWATLAWVEGLVLFCSLYKTKRTADRAKLDADELRNSLSSIYMRLETVEKRKSHAPQVEVPPDVESSDAADRESENLRKEYNDHLETIRKMFREKARDDVDHLREVVFAPLSWSVNMYGTRESNAVLFDYYENVFSLLVTNQRGLELLGEICESSYRLTGSLCGVLDGMQSECLSFMCDRLGDSPRDADALKRACEKLDSLGMSDRGRHFCERIK